jgi:hypothetical protein
VRFMLLLKGDPPAGASPSPELIDAMIAFNEELAKAGVLLAAEGLHPSADGARVTYQSGRRTVIDGPFAEAKELIAGYLLIQVRSKEEAIEWAMRCPVDKAVTGDTEAVVEIRQVADMGELPTATEEHVAATERIREQFAGS